MAPVARNQQRGGEGVRILLATSEASRQPRNWGGGGGSRQEGADRHARRAVGRRRTPVRRTTGGPSTWRDAPSSRDPREAAAGRLTSAPWRPGREAHGRALTCAYASTEEISSPRAVVPRRLRWGSRRLGLGG